MRKKISSFITAMMILLVCVFAGACGDKYKNLEFKVYYAYTEDATEWHDGTDGININYSLDGVSGDGSSPVFDENGGVIYVKILIDNVKAKHVDKITVSPRSTEGLNFSSIMVKEKEVFELDVDGYVETSLKIYENNSGKKYEIPINVARKLESIKTITSYKAAMPLTASDGYGRLNLLSLEQHVLEYYPIGLTNQKGVTYSVESIGHYERDAGTGDHEFVEAYDKIGSQGFVIAENGVLKILDGSFFSSEAYIVRVRATSIFYDGSKEGVDPISSVFDVYVVDSETKLNVPTVKFNDENGPEVREEIHIYEKSSKYAKSTVVIDESELSNDLVYNNGVLTSDGEAAYTTVVYILDENGVYKKCNFDNQGNGDNSDAEGTVGVNGLYIKKDGTKYTFSIASREESIENKVRVAYELEGFDYSHSQQVNASKQLTVVKGIVPTIIRVNDSVDLVHDSVESAQILGINNDDYNGLKFKFEARYSSNPNCRIEFVNNPNLVVVNEKEEPVSWIDSGESVYVKFKGNTVQEDLIVRTLKVPPVYNEQNVTAVEYIQITYKLSKLVSADSFKFVANVNGTDLDGNALINAEAEDGIYVRVDYSGEALVASTINLSSENPKVLFANGKTQMNLGEAEWQNTIVNQTERYDIYKIPMLATNSKELSKITMSVGDDDFMLSEDVQVESVFVMTEENAEGITVNTLSEGVKKFTKEEVNNGSFNFAIARGEHVEFSVEDGSGSSKTINNITWESVRVDNINFSTDLFQPTIVGSTFNVVSYVSGKTQVVQMNVSYYIRDTKEDSVTFGQIVSRTSLVKIQVAVFESIGSITRTPSKTTIGYVNNYYNDVASSNVTYVSHAHEDGTPSNKVVFEGDDGSLIEKNGASQVRLQFSSGEYQTIVESGFVKVYYNLNGEEIDLIESNGTSFVDNKGTLTLADDENILNGSFVVQLVGKPSGLKSISMTLSAWRFDEPSNTSSELTIMLADVDKAERILVDGDFVQTGSNSRELQMSFMDVEDGGVDIAEFKTSLEFATQTVPQGKLRFDNVETALTYLLYRYRLDEKGNLEVGADGNVIYERINNDFLDVEIKNGKTVIKASKHRGGGLFKLVLATKDSFNKNVDPESIDLGEECFDKTHAITIRISDGSQQSAYIIRDKKDLVNINKNLDKHFVLAENIGYDGAVNIQPLGVIDIEGSSLVRPFTGGLSGQFTTVIDGNKAKVSSYSIKAKIEQTVESSNGFLAGLFAILGEDANVSNLNLEVEFTNNYQSTSLNGLHIGSLAAINEGTVSNVKVTVKQPDNIEVGFVSVQSVNFGVLVALNKGDIVGSGVESSNKLTIKSGQHLTHNIGMMVGVNDETGVVEGAYQGKESLNSYTYDIILNLEVCNTNELNDGGLVKYYVGSVAGTNKGSIKNILVGGQVLMSSEKTGSGDLQSGALGGIAGRSLEDSSIQLASALSLDVLSTSKAINVGGIVGNTTGATIDSVKFISATTKDINTVPIHGKLSGVANVAGIVAAAENGLIKYASVESFIDLVDDKTFYTIHTTSASSTVAGIAIASGTNVENSFITARISSSGTVYLIANVAQTNSYFIGDVVGSIDETEEYLPTYRVIDGILNNESININEFMLEVTIDSENTEWANIYYVDGANYAKAKEYAEGKTYKQFNVGKWITDVVSDLVSGSTWATEENYNVVKINGVEVFFPYIVRTWEENGVTKAEPLQIVKPQSISASIDQEYKTLTDSVYVSEFNYAKYASIVKESVIVNFFKDAGDEANAHYLFSNSGNGLLDLSLLPENAQGGYVYEIVDDGHNYAYINSKKQIVFTRVSDQTPIIVRIYSVFNTEIELYVAFYSQSLATKLILSSSSVYYANQPTYDYEMSLYTNQNNKIIALKAENMLDGEVRQNLFDAKNMAQYLKVQQTSSSVGNSKLEIDVRNHQNMTLKIKEDLTDDNKVTANDHETITFSLYVAKEYFGTYTFEGIDYSYVNEDVHVGDVKLRVNLYNSAQGINVDGSNAEITTSDDIEFEVDLLTEYVKTSLYNTNTTIAHTVEVNENGELVYNVIDGSGNVVQTDGIIIKIEVVSGLQEAEKLCNANNVNSFAEMFKDKAQILSSLFKPDGENVLGYTYRIFLELNDTRIARYIENDIKFTISVYAVSNSDINSSANPLEITLKPAVVQTVKMENYVIQSLNMHTNYTNIVTNDNVETSIVEPGGLGNVMMIYLEPAYSQVSSLSIKASSIYVPSLGRNVQIRFTQLALDKRSGNDVFTTLSGDRANTQVGDTLDLNLISQINRNGIDEYTGIICVRIHIEEPFIGLEAALSVTLTVKTQSNPEGFVRTKNLLTSYLPGTDLIYDEERSVGEGLSSGYLIQKGTSNNEVELKIYGYQFNSNPDFDFAWELPEGSSYTYVDGKKGEITDGTNIFYLGDYISSLLDKDVSNIEYNKYDDSYTLKILLNVGEGIPAPFKVSAELSLVTKDGQLKTSPKEDNEIIFYPTDYILNSANVEGLTEVTGRKRIQINQTKSIELNFVTDNENRDLSEDIYEDLLDYAEACDALEGKQNFKLASLFSYYKGGRTIRFSDPELYDEFEFNLVENSIISITGISQFESIVKFNVDYDYEFVDGEYKLVFGKQGKQLSTTFTLSIIAVDEKEEVLIYAAEDIYNSSSRQWKLVEGAHYVLLNDITLTDVVPITTAIGSFDGNNRVISIKNFVVDNKSGDYGLFANVGTYTVEDEMERPIEYQTILKNMIVDYGSFSEEGLALKDVESNIVFGGLAAKNTGGLIYNCDVMNLASGNKEININVGTNSNIVFGGLVGINNGNITNSRVGRLSYSRITATRTTESVVEKRAGGLTFKIFNKELEGDSNKDVNQFEIVAGGFVGENAGIIASSYLTRTNIINYSTNEIKNITAGFVGNNNEIISYSYAKADDETLTIAKAYSTGYVVENKGNGIVSGFVYNNSGTINNSYANIELKTVSAYIAGFVYNNTGSISESYAASTMNSGLVSSYAEQPFVGVDSKGDLLSNGKLENTYYLMRSTTDEPYLDGDKDVAQGLNEENFQNGEYLVGFAFILSNSKVEREQGIWSYYTTANKKRILPELMNADTVSHSYRFVVNSGTEQAVLRNTVSYAEGTANNPYIISNVKEFNDVFTGPDRDDRDLDGYVRFINNINFNNDQTAIETRSNYMLGKSSTKTSVEGNGMTIDGIYLDVGDAIVNKIGLFAEIKNAYIKNLTLKFATPKTDGQFSTTTATYSGGLAGLIEDTAVINIKLVGENTTLTGSNFVGGVAGLIKGNSLVYGIETNLNVKAITNEDYFYYSEEDYRDLNIQASTRYPYATYLSHLSYAGGVAGVLDLTKRANINHNVQFVDILGDQMAEKTFDGNLESNILGEYAGGVAGYASRETSSFKLRYYMGENESIRGDSAVGGLFGVYLGKIVASQVTAEEEIQYVYDTAFGDYILDINENNQEAEFDSTTTGNMNLIRGSKYVGGLVGLGIDTIINASYSKATISSGQIVGGLVGLAVAGTVNYSYAVPFVHITENLCSVGGLFGEAYSIRPRSQDRNMAITPYETLIKHKGVVNKVTDIQFTYSTLIVDELEYDALTETQKENMKFDYICADYDADNTVCLNSNQNSNLMYVYAGPVDYRNEFITNETNKTNNSSIIELHRLYNVGDPDQVVAFQEVFSGWSLIKYWSLNDERYFPLLTNKSVDNYIEIDSAGDLEMIQLNLGGKYKVVRDFEVNEKTANWIISGEFKGVLVGELMNDDRRPTITIKGLNPDLDNNSAGFFEKTYNATISNLAIAWLSTESNQSAIDLTNVNHLTMVSGLTCEDEGSLISNVEVRAKSYSDNVTKEVKGYILNETSKTIGGFGGIVGHSTDTNILGCNFTSQIKAKLKNTNGEEVYFGGSVANVRSSENDAAVINSVSIGAEKEVGNEFTSVRYPKTTFDLTVDGSCDQAVYIGGSVGNAEGAAIASNKVGSVNSEGEKYKQIDININLSNLAKNLYVGGIVAYAKDAIVATSESSTNMLIYGSTAGSNLIRVGGMIGEYRIETPTNTTEVTKSNSYSTISTNDLTNKLTANLSTNVMLSTGVATLSGLAELRQCLFTGSVNTEGSTIGVLYAGGTAAQVNAGSSGYIDIEEITTNAILTVGTSETTKLYAGGLVGVANKVELSYSAALGRVIPVTSQNATDIYVGGIIGLITPSDDDEFVDITVNNSYSLTSIIADSIADKAISQLSIGALVGSLPDDCIYEIDRDKRIGKNVVNFVNVYYSSDFALFTDENKVNEEYLGTNLAATTMIRSNVWHATLRQEDGELNSIWRTVSRNDLTNLLPYLSALEEAMVKFGILTKTIGSEEYDYIQGSAMRPIIIDNRETTFVEDKYNYYLLACSDNQKTPTLGGILNGILIGEDREKTFTLGSLKAEEILAVTYHGIVSGVAKHSAVSNIHVVIDEEKALEGNSGIIVGHNLGVIYNCSVQGTAVKLTGSARVGLIASHNEGMISYSFSTAEIIGQEGMQLGGIVHTNGGKLLSNYFTGYVEGAEAAGILHTNDGTNGYVYNNYMAGVIKTIKEEGNAFGVNNCTNGSKNFIDYYSDITYANAEFEEDEYGNILQFEYLMPVQTSSLMGANELDGDWYFTVNGGSFVDNAETFGYNYNYPVYRFNKQICSDGKTLTYYGLSNQLYTGTGVVKGDEDPDTSNSFSLNERYSVLVNEESSQNYKDAFKIPHLGVLTAVHNLVGTSRNYVLIYDINGMVDTNKYIVWTGIGSSATDINGFAKRGPFQGVFITNKYYNYNIDTETPSNAYCFVTNLAINGLFGELDQAYIGDIKLGSFHKLENSGALGVIVKAVATAVVDSEPGVNTSSNVEVNNVEFVDGSIILGKNNYGSLFGTVAGNLTINKFTTAQSGNATVALFADNHDTVTGLIAGTLSGTINLAAVIDSTSGTDEMVSTYYSWIIGNGCAGGIVGQMLEGSTINGNGNTVYIVNTVQRGKDSPNFTNILGGVAGKTSGNNSGVSANINNIVVNVKGNEIKTNAFGGLVGLVGEGGDGDVKTGLTTDENIRIIGTKEVTFKGSGDDRYYGLIAGLQQASISVAQVQISNIEKLIINCSATPITEETSDNDRGIGTFIGVSKAGEISIKHKLEKIELEVDGVPNVGGLIGYMNNSENVEIINPDQNIILEALITGTTNVGGIYGYFDGNIPPKEENPEDPSNAGFQPDKYIKATIIIEGSSVPEMKNFGGLFGLWNGFNEDIETEIINVNEFIIKSEGIAYNIGGVAGKVTTSSTIQNMSNEGGFTNEDYFDMENSDKIDNAKIEEEKVEKLCKTINVGGVFGYVESASIKNIKNTAIVLGYQNVGGLVGYYDSGIKTISIDKNIVNISNIKPIAEVNEYYLPIGVKLYEEIISNGEGLESGEPTKKVLDPEEIVSTAQSQGDVYGVLNVGGVVGYSGNYVKIENLCSVANVYGNTNVGGLVGFSRESEINNNYVVGYVPESGAVSPTSEPSTDEEDKSYGEVKGIYYNKKTYTTDPTTGRQTEHVDGFIPTSVGGLVGASSNSSIQTNLLYGVRITSTEESKGEVISTISNNMMNVVVGSGNEGNIDLITDNDKVFIVEGVSKTKFTDVRSGFGGFIGTVDSATLVKEVDGLVGSQQISTNLQVDTEINAQLGINVGTFYGGLKFEETINTTVETESRSIILVAPKLYSTNISTYAIDVNGAYNTGGVVGYVDGGTGISTYNLSNTDLSGYAKIQLQNKIKGFYVGGLIGKTNANKITGLAIQSNNFVNSPEMETITTINSVVMQIHTNNSYYSGGLIGCANVNKSGTEIIGRLGEWKQGEEGTPNEDKLIMTDKSDSIVATGQDEKSEFGALIGMLKAAKSSDGNGFSITVNGEHKKAFTINVVENSNYADGNSRFDSSVTEDGEYIIKLFAESYYVNLDSFTIVGSKDESLYSSTASNPLNSSAKGWSKQYTGFRQFRRNIPIQENNGAQWDSVTTLFDAQKITHVGTIENLGLTDKDLPYRTNPKGSDIQYKKFDKDYICFTVYEESEIDVRLYSAIGSANVVLDQSENETKSFGDLKDEKAKWWQWVLGVVLEERPLEIFYVDANDKDNGLRGLTYLTYGNGSDWKEYDTLDNHKAKLQNEALEEAEDGESPTSGKISYLSYFVKDYMGGDAVYGENKGAYFVFDIIYDNKSMNGLKYNTPNDKDLTISGYNDNSVADSGCIFEVNGIYDATAKDAMDNVGSTDWFAVVVKVISFVIDVVIFVASYGAGTGALAAGKQAVKYAAKQTFKNKAKIFLKAAGKRMLRMLKKKGIKGSWKFVKNRTIAMIFSMLVTHAVIGYAFGQEVAAEAISYYVEPEDVNFGFKSSTYNRTIRYKMENGKIVLMQDTDDSLVVGNGKNYEYFSATRPSDYHINQYVGIEIGDYSETADGVTFEKIGDGEVKDRDGCLPQFSKNNFTWIETKKVLASDDEKTEGFKDTNETIGLHTDGKYYLLEEKYQLINGQYYINVLAGNVDSAERVTLKFQPEQYNDLGSDIDCETPNWIDVEGGVYVHGSYDEATGTYSYSTDDYEGNILVNDGAYSINGVTIELDLAEHQQTRFNYIPSDYTAGTDSEDEIKTDPNSPLYHKYTLGYDYFNGAYYTANGTKGINAAGGGAELVKFAKFAYTDDYNSTTDYSGTHGVDYLLLDYVKKGEETSSNGQYYKYSGVEYDLNEVTRYDVNPAGGYWEKSNGDYIQIATGDYIQIDHSLRYNKDPIKKGVFEIQSTAFETSGEDQTDYIKTNGLEGLTNKTITVAVYPSSFKNPYVTERDDAKDDIIWLADADNNNTQTPGIKFAPKYFVYEGGYKTKDNMVYVRVNEEEKPVDITVNVQKVDYSMKQVTTNGFDDVEYIDGDGDNEGKYVLSNGTQKTIAELLVPANSVETVTYDKLVTEWETYKNYFMPDENGFVCEVFAKDGNDLYRLNTQYLIKDGLLHKLVPDYSNNNTLEVDMYKGMYLANNKVGLYTRYRYVKDGSITDFSSSPWSGYQLVPKKGTAINNNSQTEFIETTRVIMSAKVDRETGNKRSVKLDPNNSTYSNVTPGTISVI